MTSESPVPFSHDNRTSRDRILAAAEDVFAEHGFDATTLRLIAAGAEVPIGLIAYHFGNKAGLYRAVFEARSPAMVEQRMAGLALCRLETDPDKRLELIVKSVLVPMLGLRLSGRATNFGMLLAREVSDPRSIERGIVRDILDPIATAVTEQLSAVLPGRSRASIHWIYHAMIGAMVYAMGDAGRICRLSGGAADPNDVDRATLELISIVLDGIRPRP